MLQGLGETVGLLLALLLCLSSFFPGKEPVAPHLSECALGFSVTGFPSPHHSPGVGVLTLCPSVFLPQAHTETSVHHTGNTWGCLSWRCLSRVQASMGCEDQCAAIHSCREGKYSPQCIWLRNHSVVRDRGISLSSVLGPEAMSTSFPQVLGFLSVLHSWESLIASGRE